MKGLWLENGILQYRADIPEPEVPEGEALIQILLAGICSTDLELVKGYYPFRGVLGHEFVGRVISSPSEHAWEGKRVVGEINVSCGQCSECKAGRPRHCINRSVLGIVNRNGVFADYCVLPVDNLHEVPESLSNEVAVFTEPLAAALEIQQQVQIHPSDKVLIVGAGRLGLLIAFSLSLTGCDLKVVARRERPQIILSNLGIETIQVDDVYPRMADVVVEATGSPDGLSLAKRAVRPRGTIVLKSTYKGDVKVNFSEIVVDEITLIGSRCGAFEPALRLLARGMIKPDVLIDGKYHLEDGIQAFEKAASPGTLKILISPD